jgi:hypothetical protein
VRAEGISRYQHIRGEQQFAGPAGTLLVAHHGLWHAGQPNPGERERWMYKIRLNPRVPQVKLWNTGDLAALQNDARDHVFGTVAPDSVASCAGDIPGSAVTRSATTCASARSCGAT